MHLRAAVKPVQAGAAPTGSVTFLDGATVIGTATLAPDAGTQVARLTIGFRVGSHSLTARYGGDATYAASTSLPVTFAIGKAASTSKISQTKATKPGFYNVIAVEKAVAPGRGIPSGTVTVQLDQLAPQALALSSTGRAHLTLALNPGSHVAKVTYGGGRQFASNTGSLTFTV